MRNLLNVLFFLFAIISPELIAQQKFKLSFGGSGDEQGRDLLQLPSKEYILVGAASESNLTNSDFYIIKTAENGLKLWEKKLGTNQLEFANSVFHDSIINKIIVSGFVSNQQTGYDGLIMVVNDNGDSLTSYQVGRNSWDFINSSTFSAVDSTWLFAGVSYNEISGNKEGWVFKIKDSGEIKWQKYFAEEDINFEFNSITITSNNDILISGTKINSLNSNQDFFYSRLNLNGDIIWDKIIDVGLSDGSNQIIEAINGLIFSIGYTNGRGGGGLDYFVIKANSDGDTISCFTLGAYDNEIGMSITETKENHLIISGQTYGPGYHQIFIGNYSQDFNYINQTSYVAAEPNPNLSNYVTIPYKVISTSDTGCAIISSQTNLFESNKNILFIKSDRNLQTLTSIRKNENSTNLIFNNPVREFIFFNRMVEKVVIYNQNSEISVEAKNTIRLSTEKLASGLYFMKIQESGFDKIYKIIKIE